MRVKNKRLVTYVFILVCLLSILIFLLFFKREDNIPYEFSEDYVLGTELPSLLSFTYYEENEWKTKLKDMLDRKLTYEDINRVLELLNVADYVRMSELLSPGEDHSQSELTSLELKESQKLIDRKSFYIIYDQIVDILDVKQKVKSFDIIILSDKAKDGLWLTQKGYRKASDFDMFFKKYKMFTVYSVNKQMIGIKEKSKKTVRQSNVFVHTAEAEQIDIIFQKEELTFQIKELNDKIENTICDLEWKDGKISAVYKKEDTIQGKVLSYNKKEIEIEGYGVFRHSGSLNIYKTYGTVEQLDESKLVIGNLFADFVVAKKVICGIILKEPATIENIRVLLLNGDQTLYEDTVISANETFSVTLNMDEEHPNEKNVFPANTPIRVSDYLKEKAKGHLRLETESVNGRIFFVNENQEKTSLDYRGIFEIRKQEEGFAVVNELSLEEYLYGVVPSEMPASYEKEALRVQAVCARSYACIQMLSGGYAELGAHVDDSTSFQVYNKQPEDEKTNLAVQDTVGEVILYQGRIAEAYYFSTSCGFTESIGVWNVDPDGTYGYLSSQSLLIEEAELDLTDEKVFAEFIQNKEIKAYDSDGAYFRWKAKLHLFEYKDNIIQAALERKAANPDSTNIRFLNGDESREVENGEGFGNIETIAVEKRSEGGSINKLRIRFENGSILVANEYNIRIILGAAITSMTDKDDNQIESIPLLPSTYFTAIPVETGYSLFGGGYGHGIGMSQNGANGMAKAGYSYTDILLKFYQDIAIENVYNDQS